MAEAGIIERISPFHVRLGDPRPRIKTWRCPRRGYRPIAGTRRPQLSVDVCRPRRGCSKPAARRCCCRSTGQQCRIKVGATDAAERPIQEIGPRPRTRKVLSIFWLRFLWLVQFPGGNHQNCCHQMSYFKAKMHRIRFRMGLSPTPRWRSLQRSTRTRTWIEGSLLLTGRKGKRKGWEVEGRGST